MKNSAVPKKWLKGLDSDGTANLITAVSDIALLLDAKDGLVRDVAFGSDELQKEVRDSWVGHSWASLVTVESRPKVEALLKDAGGNLAARWRHVNHRTSGEDLPIVYAAMRVGDGKLVAVGRSLRPMAQLQQQLVEAQQSMEHEYARLRQAELRHRLLFQVASEAVLVLDAANGRILEANPAASRLLGDVGKRLVGRTFVDCFDSSGKANVESLLGAVRAVGHAERIQASAAVGDRSFFVAASLFREEKSVYFLVRLSAVGETADTGESPMSSVVLEVVKSSPEAFVVTDVSGRLLFANQAFLDLAQLASEEQARGQHLDRWLGLPGVDANLILMQLRERQTLRLLSTRLRGELGSATDVELCAVAVPDAPEPCLGFAIRDIGQRQLIERRAPRERQRSVEQLTELVGRVPLKELVRESTDVIERLCIEAALELTGDNRASAAEMLGLSRQSLYAKLRRHGLGELEPAFAPTTN